LGAPDSVTLLVEQATPPVLVAEALGDHTSVVFVVVGERVLGIVPLDTVPSVTVTTESPLTVDIVIVALNTVDLPDPRYALLFESPKFTDPTFTVLKQVFDVHTVKVVEVVPNALESLTYTLVDDPLKPDSSELADIV
jgi:hypothetical protein